MNLFIRTANSQYMKILKNDPFIPMKINTETTVDGVRVPQRSTPKNPTEFTDSEKDVVVLDTSPQLIIVDSMNSNMCHNIINCTSAKHMWDTVELIMEGTNEVKENRLDILTS